MALMDELKEQVEDEQKSYDKYVTLGQRAENAGMPTTARALYKIAQDEIRHSDVLRALYMRPELGPKPEEIKLSGEMVEVKLGRPFPQIYNDWVNLGMSIKEKVGIDDFETTAQVNFHLGQILEEDAHPKEAQWSKQMLMQKAGELGIK